MWSFEIEDLSILSYNLRLLEYFTVQQMCPIPALLVV